ncbi:MAG: RNA polymerase sigma-54 factor [Bacteroidetes bacterium]|nr:MAG: RNA polymerase sigma-54 factor [Bacteroidota bacterium]
MLKQSLQQKLLMKLSPQQIQLMKLLQIPTIALEQRIKQEIEENPALDEGPDNELKDEQDDYANEDINTEEQQDNADDEFDFSDYLDEDDTPGYKLQANNQSKDDEDRQIPFVSGTTFHDLLRTQLGMRNLSEKELKIALFIIGNLDDSGYLRRDLVALVDDLAFSQNIMTDEKEVERLLKMIQSFDPPGVGARNLQECLLIQINRLPYNDEHVELAKQILERFFNEFTKKHYSKIIKRLEITEEELKEAINVILELNPKPGNSLNESTKIVQHIIPDFIVSYENGELSLRLNARNAPELHISRKYREMMETYSKSKDKKEKRKNREALTFVKQKIDSAKWFIDAIKQRQHTLLSTMEAILEYQRDYFMEGDETLLKPMILKDIAEKVNLDISTISRVVNSKYVQTPFGTFLLKDFFSESLSTDSGEEVSTREVKKILQNIIDEEDKQKPYSDEKLAKLLNEKGYNIARRTIAKYREQLGIPVARMRKELK